MGSKLGALKLAAKKAGLSLEDYQSRIASGLKRCTSCEEWKCRSYFRVDASRWDGLAAGCSECLRTRSQVGYDAVRALFGLPAGPPRIGRRSGDAKQAKSRINHDVDLGLRPSPNDLHCAKCGHKGGDRRHEYHHVGYDELHHYDVLPLCVACHHEEHHTERADRLLDGIEHDGFPEGAQG